MHISNFRLGFATNSSSAHSIVLIPGGKADNLVHDYTFGWEHWSAGSRDTKLVYLGLTIKDNLCRLGLDDYSAGVVATDLVGVPLQNGYIDHQSALMLPSCAKTRYGVKISLDREFIADFKKYLEKEEVVILGGNDNDDHSHPQLGRKTTKEVEWSLPRDGLEPLVSRKDGAWWTLFNRSTGAKIRLSFEDDPAPYLKASAPELVDLKITDFCPYGCPFCYQGSHGAGAHADRNVVDSILNSLSHLGVFEIAIGGGEPTLHPQFLKILEHAGYQGIIPNITTRNMSALRDPVIVNTLKECGSAVGYSISNNRHSSEEIYDIKQISEKTGLKIVVHAIVGTMNRSDLGGVLYNCFTCHVPILLLGLKEVGRGSKYKFYEGQEAEWYDTAKGVLYDNWGRVSIDTVLAQKTPKWEAHDRLSVQTKEGTFSMYIDAVSRMVGPSSYEPQKLESVDNLSPEEIQKRFQAW